MLPQSIQDLIKQLSKLPDIGPRAATRLVFHLINQDQKELDNLSSSIKDLKNRTKLCPQCFNLTNDKLCSICSDQKRNKSTICIVETVLNIPPIEKTRQFNGLYHILGGLISPGNGTGPDNLKIKDLVNRIKNSRFKNNVILSQQAKNPVLKSRDPSASPQDDTKIKEIIFALSPTTEGDTTTLYIEKLLQPMKIKTSRLARGLATGSDLEYIDENTLTSAFRGRR